MAQKGLTLSEFNRKVGEAIHSSFPDDIWVIGEISDLKVSSSGHCYMEMVEKDPESDSIIAKQRAAIWSYTFRMIAPYFESSTGFKLTSGLKVLVNVRLEFHEVYGLSLTIKDIDPSYTIGDLARKKKEVILRLEREGVIDMNRNLPFPMVPQRIAVISSISAAGWGDFQSSLSDNLYGFNFDIRLFQATMQGEEAERSIIDALEKIFEREAEFDVVVIIRGGGATSDMDCFNNYYLAYYITQFPLPVLTGIGHERDESVADIVAHRAFKTPTAVAEFLINKLSSFDDLIRSFQNRLADTIRRVISAENQKLSMISQKLTYIAQGILKRSSASLSSSRQKIRLILRDYRNRRIESLKHYSYRTGLHPLYIIKRRRTEINNYFSGLKPQISLLLDAKKEKILSFERSTGHLDPVNILKRGFSITYLKGKMVKDGGELTEGDHLNSRFYKGSVRSIVIKNNQK